MDINEVFQFVSWVSNKYQAANISADEFNLACKVVTRDLFNVKIGLPEAYQPGSPYPPQAYQVTQKITDDMRVFIKDVSITKASGYFALPTDYAALSSVSYHYVLNQTGGAPLSELRYIEVLTDAELRSRLEDNVLAPDLKYPVAAYRSEGLLVYPTTINKLTLTYLRYPAVPVFGFSVSNDEYIYDANTSTQIDFPETLHSEICARICRYFSINIREAEFYTMIQERINKGA